MTPTPTLLKVTKILSSNMSMLLISPVTPKVKTERTETVEREVGCTSNTKIYSVKSSKMTRFMPYAFMEWAWWMWRGRM